MQTRVLTFAVLLCLLYLPATTPGYAQSSPEQATVIFYRADKFAGKAVRFSLSQNGQSLGYLLAGTEIVRSFDPGTYTFTASSPSVDGTDQITLTVQAGVTYRVEGEVLMGWPVGRTKFVNVSESGTPTQTSSPPASAAPSAPSATKPKPAAGRPEQGNFDAAALGLASFSGQWQMQMWSLTADGNKQHASGTVSGIQDDANSIRLVVNEFSADYLPNATGGGEAVISVNPQLGVSLLSKLPASQGDLRFAGRFGDGRYVFFLVGSGGETMTGVERSSMRIEFAANSDGTWVAETYNSMDGKTVLVQSATFSN